MNIRDDLEIFGVVYNKQFEICKYIAENTNPSTDTFIGTYKKINKDLGVAESTIARIMKKLQANNLIKKVQNGVWLVDSNFIEKIKKGIWLINLNSGKGENE
jgi:replication and maintenance protein